MIVDVHTHIWSTLDQLGPEVAARLRTTRQEHWGQLDASGAAHDAAMNCVDVALVLGYRSARQDASIPNEFVAEFVSKAPNRRVGGAGIDPMADDALDRLESAIGLGLCAVAVAPPSQGFHPAHSLAMRVYERCVELGLPLFVTDPAPLSPTAVLEFGRPFMWDEVARSFPDLRIVIGQVGHPWIDETLLLLGKHANVYAELSGIASRPWQLYNTMLHAAGLGALDKLLFGSAFPHDTPAKAIEALYSVNSHCHGTQMPTIPRSSVRAIVERDSLKCLGIDLEVSVAERRDSLTTTTPFMSDEESVDEALSDMPTPRH